jgi:hypothetical protein
MISGEHIMYSGKQKEPSRQRWVLQSEHQAKQTEGLNTGLCNKK